MLTKQKLAYEERGDKGARGAWRSWLGSIKGCWRGNEDQGWNKRKRMAKEQKWDFWWCKRHSLLGLSRRHVILSQLKAESHAHCGFHRVILIHLHEFGEIKCLLSISFGSFSWNVSYQVEHHPENQDPSAQKRCDIVSHFIYTSCWSVRPTRDPAKSQ